MESKGDKASEPQKHRFSDVAAIGASYNKFKRHRRGGKKRRLSHFEKR